jgi:hypothetical protein
LEGTETTRAGDRSVFAVAHRTFSWADVVAAARAWGEWAGCEQAAREASSALARAQRAGVALTGPEFDAEEERFRRTRGLLAADELIWWLARRDVELSAWRDYVRGVVLRRRGSEPDGDLASADAAAVWVQAMCSGTLDSVAQRLARRVAVADAGGRLTDFGSPLTGTEVAELDQIYEEFCERSATVDAIEREVDRHRLDWLTIEWRSQAAADEDTLREAALCIREDGREFEEVATAAGLAVDRRRTDLDGADVELRADLLGARVGDLLGPLTVGGEYRLVQVLDKRPPTSDDPEIRARARDAVVGRAVEAESVDRVRWDERI